MNLQFVDWQYSDGVGRLTLKRPPLNILNIAMLRELGEVLDAATHEESMRALVLRAEGKLFSAGVDVADHTADKVGEMIPLVDRVCAALADFPAPTLAAVHGHALGGGCEVALRCDLIVAAEGANFGQPEIKLATVAPIASLRLPNAEVAIVLVNGVHSERERPLSDGDQVALWPPIAGGAVVATPSVR